MIGLKVPPSKMAAQLAIIAVSAMLFYSNCCGMAQVSGVDRLGRTVE